MDERRTLAWHETLEMHELVAFQSNGLIKLKKMIREVKDPQLRQLYNVSIQGVEQNLRELLPFFPQAPHREDEEEERADNPFYSGDLLGFAKTSVRSYAIAITETATPQLKKRTGQTAECCHPAARPSLSIHVSAWILSVLQPF
ncbi:spore coat protein [Bacillus subtilis]